MAPPKSPWNKIAAQGLNTENASPSKPSPAKSKAKSLDKPQPPTPMATLSTSTMNYTQAQDDEIEALKAIYMEDFEEKELKGAWSKTSDRMFRLRLRAPTDDEMSVVLSVHLTATYPKTLPIITIDDTSGLNQKTQKRIKELIEQKPTVLIGEVMIYDIAASIQDSLDDAVQLREQDDTLPSLDDERAVREAEVARLMEQQEVENRKKQEEEKAEADRLLKHMVDEEMNRRKDLKRKNKSNGPAVSLPNAISANAVVFDHLITVQDEGIRLEFNAVTSLSKLSEGPITTVYTALPFTSDETDDLIPIALKRYTVKGSGDRRLKKGILDFEAELESLKRLRHQNIASVLDFKIEREESVPNSKGEDWKISILVEYGCRGSLNDVLDIAESVPVVRVRSWTIELLEALDFYHRNGVIHNRIHPGNVLICKASGGTTTVKLADAGYQDHLYNLRDLNKDDPNATSAATLLWAPPDISSKTRKTDIWHLGVVFCQMLFGVDIRQKHSSPGELIDALNLTDPLVDIIRKFFKMDPKKRPSAFDLIPCEFLRLDAPIFSRPQSPVNSRSSWSTSLPIPRSRVRRDSIPFENSFSRYASEWVEAGRLGKGGYGEVVKARNKLDGRFYAIKKIKLNSASALSDVLSEVRLLSRLNHPYVVRYYTAWPEEDFADISESVNDSDTFDEEPSTVSPGGGPSIEFGPSTTGGLDFISSSGYPKIEFGEDSDDGLNSSDLSDDDEQATGEEFSEGNGDGNRSSAAENCLKLRRTTSSSRPRPVKTTLYIQMEYCERRTLRDIIRKGNLFDNPDEIWRLLRQILEGLAHIHSHGIIHRDLKPDNIFMDVTSNPQIGDFGLATSEKYHLADRAGTVPADGDMTRSIGTALYVAPELRSDGGSYDEKVDMYSLGIILFEMCHPLKTAMERDSVLRQLREKTHTLPSELLSPEKSLQATIINSLISHRASERPSSTELLRSGKLPLQIEDETIRQALQGLSDPSSPYYYKMMSALFSRAPNEEVKNFAWDLGAANGAHETSMSDILLRCLIKDKLTAIFKRHGAVESQRQIMFPKSSYYANRPAVQFLDASGTLVQLPYDLTLPHARSIARRAPALEKTYTFGTVYRDTYTGGAPRSSGEADFDIVSFDNLDLPLKEAEVIKVLDEIINEFPSLSSTQMCFHLNHSDLLELIMEFCRITEPQRESVKETLSKLNIQQWTWQKIRNELRTSSSGVPSTSLDELQRFDWRDTPEKAFGKLRKLFANTNVIEKTHAIFARLTTVIDYMKQLDVQHKVYISPLSSFNEKFYTGGILFQCLYDTKRRDVLAAGGRYDRLIQDHHPKLQGNFSGCHAVGMNLGWERKTNFLKKAVEEEHNGIWSTRRCDILVASHDPSILRSQGVKLLGELWAHDLSAELAVDARTPERLLYHYRDDKFSWIIIIRHDAASTGKPELRVKSLLKNEDTDLRAADLLSYLRAEIRDRDHKEGTAERARLLRHPSSQHPDPITGNNEKKGNVQVLIAQHKSKKSNKWSVVEAAQARSRELLASYGEAPIAAIETSDKIMDMIRNTKLSDPDSWRHVVQSVPLSDRAYLQEVHGMLLKYERKWKEEGEVTESRIVFVYNFRTGGILMYDLGL
ncbi:kinase-like protein [Patellaria atrata CBS 101060]|uniref:non-specific serine/threonine protein kinase n=1 Tax=Patellaria atrata CBS 101060 TaxID=1346257 RepID=A0A9P4SHB7_9PEZI|nr:kinase-like protein [Patellaria atrata CBS 101060]